MTVAMILDNKKQGIISALPESNLSDICSILAEKRIGAIIITNQDNTLIGILSERDIVGAIAEGGIKALQSPAKDYMTSDVVTCSSQDTIASIMAKMTAGRFRHIPVLDDNTLIGVISIGDVVKHRIQQAEREAEEMRAYITSG